RNDRVSGPTTTGATAPRRGVVDNRLLPSSVRLRGYAVNSHRRREVISSESPAPTKPASAHSRPQSAPATPEAAPDCGDQKTCAPPIDERQRRPTHRDGCDSPSERGSR